ncbi:MAG: metallophosphoesterase family protein [Clostridia bacterium]|nr:metallophosphoesterase family protein [Clostridia bacterium]
MGEPLRVAVFADIHSNFAALQACLEDSKTLGAAEYVVLGDIVSDWHQPNECVDLIRDLTPLVIKGNREQYMTDAAVYMDLWEIYHQFASLLWTYRTLTPENLTYLTSLPPVLHIQGNGISIRAVHGSPRRSNELMRREDGEGAVIRALSEIEEDVLLFAHTHEQWQYDFDGKTAINPGSVGSHFNYAHGAEYALLEFGEDGLKVTFRQVPYDMDQNFRNATKTELYEKAYPWISVIYSAAKNGCDELRRFLADIEEVRKQNEFSQGGPIPNDIYDQVFDELYAPYITKLITGQDEFPSLG